MHRCENKNILVAVNNKHSFQFEFDSNGGFKSVLAQWRSSAVKLHKSRRDDTQSRVYITSGGKRRRGDEKGSVCSCLDKTSLRRRRHMKRLRKLFGDLRRVNLFKQPGKRLPRTAWHLGNLWHLMFSKRDGKDWCSHGGSTLCSAIKKKKGK